MAELDHYLDDFLIVGLPESQQCHRYLETSMETCEEAGCPVVGEKMEGPAATEITLLGIELDLLRFQLRLPQEKLRKLRKLLAKWDRCNKRELVSLAGHLRPGRHFL